MARSMKLDYIDEESSVYIKNKSRIKTRPRFELRNNDKGKSCIIKDKRRKKYESS